MNTTSLEVNIHVELGHYVVFYENFDNNYKARPNH